MEKLNQQSALLIIDVQEGFDDPVWGKRNNPQAEKNILKLLHSFRSAKYEVIHVQHDSTEANSPLRPGQPGNNFHPQIQPQGNEHHVRKNVNSGFIGTDLETHLKQHNLTNLVIVGISTDHCVSTTTRMAGNLGFTAFVVADATYTFNRQTYDGRNFPADEVHALALASLHNEFATVVTTDQVLEALGAPVNC